MSLKERLKEDMRQAIKGREKLRLSTIRLIRASLKNKEIELRRDLKDDDLVQILSTIVKQRKESIEYFKRAGRADLLDKEEAELKVVMSYMPPQLTISEIEELVQETIKAVEAQGIKDTGMVMKELMPRIKGRAEGGVVREIVQKKLSCH